MKKVILLNMFFLSSFLCFSQGLEKKNDIKIINKYLSLVKTQRSYFFLDNQGHKSQEYTYAFLRDGGFVEITIVPPANERIVYSYNRCYIDDNTIHKIFHLWDLMKEMKIIDDFRFVTSSDLTIENFRNGFVDDNGYASKNGKFAIITNKGEFLTDFKYRDEIFFDSKPLINYYNQNGKWISVILDKSNGKELLSTKDTIVKYWNPNNHLIKNKRNKYFLTYQGKKYKVPKEFRFIESLPIESTIFTYNKFIDIKGKKIKSNLIPYTNFYKGYCIVLEIIKEEQKYNYYGEALPQRETRMFKIINEKFETVKTLPDIGSINGDFNKYGQINASMKSHSSNEFIMDYNGNYIIQPSKFINRIEEIYEGLYKVTDRSYPPTTESSEQENYYNQKGKKIINKETLRIGSNFTFKEGVDKNYIVSYGIKYITLDKENNVIDSYYK